MKKFCLLLLLAAALGVAETPAAPEGHLNGPGPNGWSYTELKRFTAPEARQGVAADADFFYAVSNHDLGKYRKDTGEKVAVWNGPENGPLIHLNAGIVYQGKLYCSHSNYPGVPMFGSVEIWDTTTLKHVGSHSFGRTDGSFTWLDRRNGRWLACFVAYAKRGGEPGRGTEWTKLVEYDDEWRETGGWVLPPDLIAQLSARGYSCSGGAMGPNGLLYVTGHDNTELYVLQFPEAGPQMIWLATIPVPAEGQAFAWDPVDKNVIHMILKSARQIITGRVAPPPPTAKP